MPRFLHTHFFWAATTNHCFGEFFIIVDWQQIIFRPAMLFTWPAFEPLIETEAVDTFRSRSAPSRLPPEQADPMRALATVIAVARTTVDTPR